MPIPIEQNKRALDPGRLPKIDEDVTTVIVQVGEIAETQKVHTALLERHTLLLKEIKQNQVDARLERRVLLSRQERTEIAVANLGDEVTEVKTDVSVLKTDVSMLKTDVSVLKADVSELKSDVSELKADVSELKTDVSELKADVSELKTDVSELKTDVSQIKGTLGVILSRLPVQPPA